MRFEARDQTEPKKKYLMLKNTKLYLNKTKLESGYEKATKFLDDLIPFKAYRYSRPCQIRATSWPTHQGLLLCSLVINDDFEWLGLLFLMKSMQSAIHPVTIHQCRIRDKLDIFINAETTQFGSLSF